MTIQLMQGDCLVRMAEIPDGSVDMILADLPYGTTACKWDNVIPFEPLWKHYWRVLKPNGAVVLFGSEPFSSHLRMSQIKHYKYDWVWQKNRSSSVSLAKYQPLRFSENVSVFYRETCAYYPIKELRTDKTGRMRYAHQHKTWRNSSENITDLRETGYSHTEQMRYPSNIQSFDCIPNNAKSGKYHPTQKPVALLEYLIKTYTLEGETVLDNTMGSGSTGVAAINLKRKFIGIEQDDKYFAIAQKRIAEAQKKCPTMS